MGFISNEERETLTNAEELSAGTPIPLQIVSSDEFLPTPKSAKQAEVGHRLMDLADDFGAKLGLSRRKFFKTTSGMAAAFIAMNEVYGDGLFSATRAEAASLDVAAAWTKRFSNQFVIDVHTHFVKDDYRSNVAADITPFPWRKAVNELKWNPGVKDISLQAVKFENYYKEIYFDSDTKVALISSVPGVTPKDAPLTNQQMAAARDRVNAQAGTRRMLSHALFAPGVPGWLDDLDAAIALKPDSFKGYTIGANARDEKGQMHRFHPWRMDSAEAYKGYEKMLRSGITTVCVHKGLFRPLSNGRCRNCGGSLTCPTSGRRQRIGRD